MVKADIPRDTSVVIAAFSDSGAARLAVERLQSGGVAAADIEILGGGVPAPAAPGADAIVLRRVLWQIILWGVVGGVLGALGGIAFVAIGVGPGGTEGRALQLAAWAMFGHIIASLWAGYAVLGRHSVRRLTRQPSGQILVRVRCQAPAAAASAEAELRATGAASIGRYAS